MTWKSRPSTYEEPVYEAPALSKEYEGHETERSPLRESGAHVIGLAYKIERFARLGWHRRWERLPLLFTVWVTLAVIVASLFEIIPTFLIKSNVPVIATVEPYTPLELAGRDLYLSEGCYNCHSQMVRPIRAETERYGEYSKAGEFIYDRPFQWGSRRIGPDLHRVGGKYPHLWHVRHFQDPESITPKSIMPPYPWLLTDPLDFGSIPGAMKAMRTLGVPYTDEEIAGGEAAARAQAEKIAREIVETEGEAGLEDRKVVALIAYLQRLGTDIMKTPAEPPPAEEAPAETAEETAGEEAAEQAALR
jgi:cytochrome c oxidase cbb3-type subunit I/II